MKILSYSLFLFIQITGLSLAQVVDIPDPAFLNALIREGVDTNGDSLISYDEASAMTELYFYGQSISNMEGIEAFINLYWLQCINTNISSLDLSNCSKLADLACVRNNKLTNLDISNNTKLSYINLRENPILHCVCTWTNPFPPLMVSVYLDDSPLIRFTSNCLDTLVNIPDSMFIYALINEGVDTNRDSLISKDEAEKVYNLNVSDREITNLSGIGSFINLNTLDCNGNNLAELDLSSNDKLNSLNISEMPTLSSVCVWTTDLQPDVSVDTAGSPQSIFPN